MKIVLTEFAKERHFDPDRAGTVITDKTPEDFEFIFNSAVNMNASLPDGDFGTLRPGYAPFCKLVFVPNVTNARTGTLPITPENDIWLKSEYKARTDGELPVLVRWLEMPQDKVPQATFLCIVLYDKEQLAKEGTDIGDADYGIVAILGQMHDQEEPINPATQMRNALGTEFGGSGFPLDEDTYHLAVDFWNKNATIKVSS
jgi:hypothetical protein